MHNTPTPRQGSGKVLAGFILITVGAILFLQQLDFFFFPYWLFSWPMILIIIGVFIGARQNFRNPVWVIPVIIGFVFLVEQFYPEMNAWRYIWPILFIAFGIYMIMGRNRRHYGGNWQNPNNPAPGAGPNQPGGFTGSPAQPGAPIAEGSSATTNPDGTTTNASAHYNPHAYNSDFLSATSLFGGVKKNVISKNFQGGEIVTFLGGAEINLTQADINGHVVLDVTQVMGGTRIMVPPHWNVVSEMAAIFGGVEDKRILQGTTINPNKVLVIRGTSFMGGIDIRSF